MRALLEAGADVDIRDDRLDNPFLYAGAEGLLDILRLANEAGADPALTNRFGGIALIPASERGHVEVVRYLLDGDRRRRRPRQRPRLDRAAGGGDPRPTAGPPHQAIVRMLLDAGADPELADRDGVTPLAHARARGQAEVAAILARGAGATPLTRRYPISSRFASEASIVLRPTCGSLNATWTSSSSRVSFEVITIPSPQRAWRTRSPSR